MNEKSNDDIITTQFIKKDFNLSKIVDGEFLDLIKDNFGSNVSVISLALLIADNDDETKKEIISFNYRNDKEQKNNEILVDISNPESFDKLKKILKG